MLKVKYPILSFHFLCNIPSKVQSICIRSPMTPSQHTSQTLDTIEMLESVLNEDLFLGITLLFKKTPPCADRGLTIPTVECDVSLAQDEITHSTFFKRQLSFLVHRAGGGGGEGGRQHTHILVLSELWPPELLKV